jgi:hypothetical protein
MGLEGMGFLWVFLLREKQPGVYVLMNVSQLRRVFRKGRRVKKARQLELDLWPGKRIKPVLAAVADCGRSPQSTNRGIASLLGRFHDKALPLTSVIFQKSSDKLSSSK